MTDQLDALPESVRNAVSAIDNGNGVFVDSDDGIGGAKWQIVRDALLRYREMVSDRSREMLRLVRESGELKTRAEKAEARVQELQDALRDDSAHIVREWDDERAVWKQRAERAESEVAAIKKRMADAQTATVCRGLGTDLGLTGGPPWMESWFTLEKLIGHRVRLLLDDEAKS